MIHNEVPVSINSINAISIKPILSSHSTISISKAIDIQAALHQYLSNNNLKNDSFLFSNENNKDEVISFLSNSFSNEVNDFKNIIDTKTFNENIKNHFLVYDISFFIDNYSFSITDFPPLTLLISDNKVTIHLGVPISQCERNNLDDITNHVKQELQQCFYYKCQNDHYKKQYVDKYINHIIEIIELIYHLVNE